MAIKTLTITQGGQSFNLGGTGITLTNNSTVPIDYEGTTVAANGGTAAMTGDRYVTINTPGTISVVVSYNADDPVSNSVPLTQGLSDARYLRKGPIPVSSRCRLPSNGTILSATGAANQTDQWRYTLQCDVREIAVELANVCSSGNTNETTTDGTNALGDIVSKISDYYPVTDVLTLSAVTNTTNATLTVAGKSWATNQFALPIAAEFIVVILSGAGEVTAKSVLSNTGTVLTMNGTYATPPAIGDTIQIFKLARVAVGGTRSITLSAGTRARFESKVGGKRGQNRIIRGFHTKTTFWALKAGSGALKDGVQASSDRTDGVNNQNMGSATGNPAMVGAQIGLWGVPVDPSTRFMGCIGDSIIAGSGDGADREDRGWFDRSLLGSGVCYFNGGSPGETAYLALQNSAIRADYLKYADTIIFAFGRNDLGTGGTLVRTAAQAMQHLIDLATPYKLAGKRCVVCTVTGCWTTPDSGTTINILGGVGAGSPEAERRLLNPMIRAKPYPFDDVIDQSLRTETAADSGVPKPGYFGIEVDGTTMVHPNATGHAAMTITPGNYLP